MKKRMISAALPQLVDATALRLAAGAGIATQSVKYYAHGRVHGSPPSQFQKMPNELQQQTFSDGLSRRDLNSVQSAYSGDARLRDNVEHVKAKTPWPNGAGNAHIGDWGADAIITQGNRI
jgi:hypothetical protein